MPLSITPQKTPIRINQDGVAYVGETRVTLDTIVWCFNDGRSAEGIVSQYPTLRLGDVYGAIHYYIDHKAEVDAYLAQRAQEAADLRQKVEARFDPAGIRERLLARLAGRKS
jgi:uncharacterized protein (DUF433 family)